MTYALNMTNINIQISNIYLVGIRLEEQTVANGINLILVRSSICNKSLDYTVVS